MTYEQSYLTAWASRRISRYGFHRLIQFIRSCGGTVTPRQIYRAGNGCRSAADAHAKLDLLVQLGRGSWKFQPSGERGGRPLKIFVLKESARTRAPVEGCMLRHALDNGVKTCGHARELAFDIAELIMAHKEIDNPLSPEEIDHVLQSLRTSLSSVLSPHYRPGLMPLRPTVPTGARLRVPPRPHPGPEKVQETAPPNENFEAMVARWAASPDFPRIRAQILGLPWVEPTA